MGVVCVLKAFFEKLEPMSLLQLAGISILDAFHSITRATAAGREQLTHTLCFKYTLWGVYYSLIYYSFELVNLNNLKGC